MTDHAELAACPFCGLTDSIDNATQEAGVSVRPFRSPAGGTACRVECACGASGPSKREGWAATEVWNRRSPQSILLAEIAALRGEPEADMQAMAEAGQNLQSQRIAIAQAKRQRDALVGFAVHDDDCTVNRFPGHDACSCGLSSILQQARHEQIAENANCSPTPAGEE